MVEAGDIMEALRDRIVGRVSLEKIKDYDGNVIVDINNEITEELAGSIQAAGIERVKIRSVLTCESKRGVCVMCYGRNLASGRLVELGEATGVIAAQSTGEPGTQLTMRTFHIGGAAQSNERSFLESNFDGTATIKNKAIAKNSEGHPSAKGRNMVVAVTRGGASEQTTHRMQYG